MSIVSEKNRITCCRVISCFFEIVLFTRTSKDKKRLWLNPDISGFLAPDSVFQYIVWGFKRVRIRILYLFFCFPTLSLTAQLQTANCVHGKGLRFAFDALLASVGACNCQRTGVFLTDFPECNNEPYVLYFEDNFDGDSLDRGKWQKSPHAQGALQGSQRLEYCSFRNISVENGICHITAKKEKIMARAFGWMDDDEIAEDGVRNLREYEYTSGMMWSREKFLYGKYEIRCRMPVGNGFWPAFWLFGGNRYNELDIFDSYAGTREFVTSMGHEFQKGIVDGCHASKGGVELSEWHIFSCELERDKVSFFIDGELKRVIYRVITLSGDAVPCGSDIGAGSYFQLEAYVVEPMHIIADMFLISENGPGGSIPVDGSTPFPSSFEIDYIRFWKRAHSVVKAWPNPCSEHVNISTDVVHTSITIRDQTGRVVMFRNGANTDQNIDVANIAPGVYSITVEMEGAVGHVKLVKYDP